MRSFAGFMGVGLVALASPAFALPQAGIAWTARPAQAPLVTRVEYFCSPGFVPSYGGQCVATLARDEIELYVNEPAGEAIGAPPPHRRHHRHALHARY